MSCLNLKRLLPKKKMWKLLTNKLQLKFSKSKPNKKLKHPSYKNSKKVCWPSLSIQPKKFKKQPNLRTVIRHKNHHCYSERRPPPVFVDHLYVQPISVVTEHMVSPPCKGKSPCKNLDRESSQPASGGGKSGRPESGKDNDAVNADDVWESMVLNSPQMDRINERAEEFIARFRAEMRDQEVQARRRL